MCLILSVYYSRNLQLPEALEFMNVQLIRQFRSLIIEISVNWRRYCVCYFNIFTNSARFLQLKIE